MTSPSIIPALAKAIGQQQRFVIVRLLGEPVPFARTRINKTGALFMPTKQRNATASLKLAAQAAMAGRMMFDEPVEVQLYAVFSVPASWSRRKREAALCEDLRPARKPDCDNLLKLVADAFNGIVYRDDALIVTATVTKVYGEQPEIEATISPIFPVRKP